MPIEGGRAHRRTAEGKKKPADRPPGRWRVLPVLDSEPSRLEHALHERIKELNCLYGLAQIARESPGTVDEVLRRVVALLPPAWQYPEITCARITFQGATFKSTGFKVTRWRQTARIVLHNEPVGEVAVFYLEERPPAYEGPFLREERVLLEAVAEHVAAMAQRVAAEQELQETNQQLRTERQALQEANAALRGVLSRIEEEKQDIQREIQANVQRVLMPMVYALAMNVPPTQRRYVELLRDSLEEITSPFVSHLSQSHRSLTPTQIGICSMVRNGLTSKEIAQLRGVSPATISRHRERIRRKLGLTRSATNLASYLQG